MQCQLWLNPYRVETILSIASNGAPIAYCFGPFRAYW